MRINLSAFIKRAGAIRDKLKWKSVVRFKLRIDTSPGHGPWGDCHLWIGNCVDKASGYASVNLFTSKSEKIVIKAHTLVYLLSHGCIPKGKELSHKCHIKLCCNLKHIKAETHKKNIRRTVKAGKSNNTNCSKRFSRKEVIKIRECYDTGNYSYAELAEKFDRAPRVIQKLIKKINYKYIK